MKTFILLLLPFVLLVNLTAQKNPVIQTSNLNMSKSNINKIIYSPSIISPANAQLLVNDLDKVGKLDAAAIKMWVAGNFKRYQVDSSAIQQFSILDGRSSKDCNDCAQNCQGKCIQDVSGCVCVSIPAAGVRVVKSDNSVPIIYLSTQSQGDAQVLDNVAKAMNPKDKPTRKESE